MLDERLQQMGASRLADRGDIDKEDWPAIEAWINSVVAALPNLKLKTAEQMGLTSGEPVKAPCIDSLFHQLKRYSALSKVCFINCSSIMWWPHLASRLWD